MKKRFLEAALLMILVVGLVVFHANIDATDQKEESRNPKIEDRAFPYTEESSNLSESVENSTVLFMSTEETEQYIPATEEETKETEQTQAMEETIPAAEEEQAKQIKISQKEDPINMDQVVELIEADKFEVLSIYWDNNCDQKNYGIPDKLEELLKKNGDWEAIKELNPKNQMIQYLAVTKLNGYYIQNFEFYKIYGEEKTKVAIIIKDEATKGSNFKQVLLLPPEGSEYEDERNRVVKMEDMNFDGSMDLIYNGTHTDVEFFHPIVFLWNPEKKQFEYNGSFPEVVRCINSEKKRFEKVRTSGAEDEYQIYKFIDGEFVLTKRLLQEYPVNPQLPDPDSVDKYYEYGELKKELKMWKQGDLIKYELYKEGILKESGYAAHYYDLDPIRYREFPEFDFYWRS